MKGSLIWLFLGILLAVPAHAQLNGEINAPDACATAKVNCGHGSAGSSSSSSSSGPLSTFAIIAGPGILGGVGGGFYQNPQGQYFAPAGAAGGVGVGLLGALAFREKNSKKSTKVITATAASLLVAGSATQAYQFHLAWRNHLDTGYVAPPQMTEVKQIGIVSAAAAVVTAVVAEVCFHQDKAKTNKLRNSSPIIQALAQVQISGTPQRMTASLMW
jgi:hypothetical protein